MPLASVSRNGQSSALLRRAPKLRHVPELPEVETIRRQLARLVEGRRLVRAEIRDERWSHPLTSSELSAALQERRIETLTRRGKYLLWSLQDDVFLAQHLRMTGSLLWDPSGEPAHTRVLLYLKPQARVVITDPRRFGTGQLLVGGEAVAAFFDARLGRAPLGERFP